MTPDNGTCFLCVRSMETHTISWPEQRLSAVCVMTSVEIIAPFSAGPRLVLFAVAVATGQCAGGSAGLGPRLTGTEEEAVVWTGWTAFSSRAFQNLPGASLKQKEEVELPVGTLPTNHDPKGTATLNVDRRSAVALGCLSIPDVLHRAAEPQSLFWTLQLKPALMK